MHTMGIYDPQGGFQFSPSVRDAVSSAAVTCSFRSDGSYACRPPPASEQEQEQEQREGFAGEQNTSKPCRTGLPVLQQMKHRTNNWYHPDGDAIVGNWMKRSWQREDVNAAVRASSSNVLKNPTSGKEDKSEKIALGTLKERLMASCPSFKPPTDRCIDLLSSSNAGSLIGRLTVESLNTFFSLNDGVNVPPGKKAQIQRALAVLELHDHATEEEISKRIRDNEKTYMTTSQLLTALKNRCLPKPKRA